MFEIFNYVLNGSSSSKPRRKEEDNFEIVTKPDDQPEDFELRSLLEFDFDHFSLEEKAPANDRVEAEPGPTPTVTPLMDQPFHYTMTPLSKSLYCGNMDVVVFIKSNGDTVFVNNLLCTVYVGSNKEIQAIFKPNNKGKHIRCHMNKSMIYFPRDDSETKMIDLISMRGNSLFYRKCKEEEGGGFKSAASYEPIVYKKPFAYCVLGHALVEEDGKKVTTIASWYSQVLITASTEKVVISTFDSDGKRGQTVSYDGENFKIERDVMDPKLDPVLTRLGVWDDLHKCNENEKRD